MPVLITMRTVWMLILLVVYTAAMAQADSQTPLTYTERQALWSSQQPKTRVKADVINLVRVLEPGAFRGITFVAVERRIGIDWTVQAELATGFRIDWGQQPWSLRQAPRAVGANFSLRNYHHHRRLVRAGLQAEAFEGAYAAFAVHTGIAPPPVSATGPDPAAAVWYPRYLGVGPLYGLQRTTVRFSFVDVNIGVLLAFGQADPFQYLIAPPVNRYPRFRITPVSNLRIGLYK